MKACGGVDMYRSRILALGTSWRWVVSFTPRPLYPRGERRLGGPQNRSGRRGEEKILDPTGTRIPTPLSCSPWPVAIPAPNVNTQTWNCSNDALNQRRNSGTWKEDTPLPDVCSHGTTRQHTQQGTLSPSIRVVQNRVYFKRRHYWDKQFMDVS
jgi:hypothetical protein